MSLKPVEHYPLAGLINQILIEEKGEKFYSFSNKDGKQWLIPSANTSIALNLYQPSTWKGKLIKQFFGLLKNIPFARSFLGMKQLNIDLTPWLKNRLKDLFQIKNPEFAIFCGTPSVHQKITIQISSGKKILGYCKVSNSRNVSKLFFHEQQILNRLNQAGLGQVPRCLYCNLEKKNIWLFVQTTTKTANSKIIHTWTKKHWDFLAQLHEKTKTKLRFEETDLAKSLSVLERFLNQIPASEADILKNAIARTKSYYGSSLVEFSAYHADFTPWNIYFEKGRLYTFDLEYAKTSYPPYFDFFHFNTQIAILERNYSVQKTYEFCKKTAKRTAIKDELSTVYLSYLLTVISFYFDINNKALDMTDRCYKVWLPLVQLIINQE